jgi:colicin import membrane protein
MSEVSNRPPPPRGSWRAVTLALTVHIALLAFLWIGVRWQNETPLVVEAEIWDPQIREAAPLPEPEPTPKPRVPVPAPVPVPVPEPVVKPPPKVEEPEVAKPDIALEKKKEEKKRKEQEQHDKDLAKQKAADKEKELKAEQQQKDKDAKLAKQKADDAAAKKKDEADKLADDKQRKQTEADKKVSDKRRQDDLKRMLSQTPGTGDAAKSQGPRGTPAYASKVAAKIKSNTVFDVPSDLAGNPSVEYEVKLQPDGSVGGIRLTKSSNVPGFDDAVKAAILKSEPFPKDVDGTVPGSFSLSHKPKDQ